jgi:hypothetical protein
LEKSEKDFGCEFIRHDVSIYNYRYYISINKSTTAFQFVNVSAVDPTSVALYHNELDLITVLPLSSFSFFPLFFTILV